MYFTPILAVALATVVCATPVPSPEFVKMARDLEEKRVSQAATDAELQVN
jgi:hypothetical protein